MYSCSMIGAKISDKSAAVFVSSVIVIIFTAVKMISILSKWLIVNCYGLISLKKYATGRYEALLFAIKSVSVNFFHIFFFRFFVAILDL